MRYKKEIEIHCVLCYTNKRKESLNNEIKKKKLKTDLRALEILFLSQLFLTVQDHSQVISIIVNARNRKYNKNCQEF